ncbi:stress response protein NST1-like [Senna tora]|uniref:Stress response protein NST1-like n=1 Tax=Senna tora TaxID=362788 RepID=A0A834WJG6_9FABA|nr:stress response protein NST1-like [Senna tora]
MCILCVIQKWSRRVATMLPWLVIPLIGLWALSQLLPPAFRFEITSPRLAVKELVGKNGWICGQDWLENGNWAGGSVAGKPSSWRMNESGLFGGDEHSLSEKSYSGILFFSCKLLTSFFLSIRWLWRKIFRVSSSREECSSDAEHRELLAKRGENGASLHESRGEKARRKAEEKRQARLEKELLEEEERKQREEVARLVEERRRLRDEKMEAEKDRSKSSVPSREKDSRKKHQEKRKEKDKGSSKSNSDVEELEKKAGKESVWKRDFDKKSETDRREHQKSGSESVKSQSTDNAHGKNVVSNTYNRGNTGNRYFDRMRGTFLSSSKAFGFGKGTNTSATLVKDNKVHNSIDHVSIASNRRDTCAHERPTAKSNMNADVRNANHVVPLEPQPWTAPKRSWQQLFTRSSSTPPTSNSNVICRPNPKVQSEVKSPQQSSPSSSAPLFDNPIHFGLPSPFNLSTFPNGPTSSSLGFSPAIEPFFSPVGEGTHDFRNEEQELYEEPSYVPDPVTLLGPVSESLDNFQRDLGSGFVPDMEVEKPHSLKNISAGSEVNKPSPIESPLSREMQAFPLDDATANDKGTWQMWGSPPLGQEGLGLVGGPVSWLLSSQRNITNKDDFVHSSSQKTMASLFTNDDSIISSTHSPQNVYLPNGQSGGSGTFSPIAGSNDYDPWLQNAFFPPLSGSLTAQEGASQSDIIYGSTSGSAPTHVLEGSAANSWSK